MDTTSIPHQDDTVERFRDLQERYNHELMDEEERCELGDRIQKLTRRLEAAGR